MAASSAPAPRLRFLNMVDLDMAREVRSRHGRAGEPGDCVVTRAPRRCRSLV
jgi:hypothetical protein